VNDKTERILKHWCCNWGTIPIPAWWTGENYKDIIQDRWCFRHNWNQPSLTIQVCKMLLLHQQYCQL